MILIFGKRNIETKSQPLIRKLKNLPVHASARPREEFQRQVKHKSHQRGNKSQEQRFEPVAAPEHGDSMCGSRLKKTEEVTLAILEK